MFIAHTSQHYKILLFWTAFSDDGVMVVGKLIIKIILNYCKLNIVINILKTLHFSSSQTLHIFLCFPCFGRETCLKKLFHFAFTHGEKWLTEQDSCSCLAYWKWSLKQRDFLLSSSQLSPCCWDSHNAGSHGKLVLATNVSVLQWRLIQYTPTHCHSADGVSFCLHRTRSSLLSWKLFISCSNQKSRTCSFCDSGI